MNKARKSMSLNISNLEELIGMGWRGTYLDTQVKGLNLVLSGKVDGGLPTNTLTGFLAGPNTGKTLTAVQLAISSIAATDAPALFIDLENFFSHQGVYKKYVEPILKRFNVSPSKFYLLKLAPDQLPELFRFFGLSVRKIIKGGKVDIEAGELARSELPDLNIFSVSKDKGFKYIALDGYATMLKAWLGPINVGKLPSRRFLFDAVLLKLIDVLADHDMAGVATFHAMQDTTGFGTRYVMWGGFAPLFADKNLILITKSNKNPVKDSKSNGKTIDYRDYKVERSMAVQEGLKITLMYKWEWGIDDLPGANYKAYLGGEGE